MNNEIFIEADKQLTSKEYVPIASQTLSLIAECTESTDEIGVTFSVNDLHTLLNKVTLHMEGEFEMRQTPSNYCQIIYKPSASNEAALNEEYYRHRDSVETHDDEQICLWVSEKVLSAFIDRKLYGIAFMLYFYLGYLMTQDVDFAVSHNISFKKILESCDALPEVARIKHRTTLMRALADLQDTGLIKWNAETRTFELLHITPYDPIEQKV